VAFGLSAAVGDDDQTSPSAPTYAKAPDVLWR
jgi:hypothetical protein